MNNLNHANRDKKEIDQALATLITSPPIKVAYRVVGSFLARFIDAGTSQFGESFRGFAYGIAEGQIDSGGFTDTMRLYRASLVGTFADDVEALDALLNEIGVLQPFEAIKASVEGPLRELLVIEEESAWNVLEQHFYVTDDEHGTHAYRRHPQQPAGK
ncbi:hypothetical protein [Microbacterium sp.]|uniref:hypothetical protein n=1 Tax=Microbacterium sp. TaxID=51671 RepID=UPI001AC7B46B|nr:hypothetical protein [Microbacterium sp.]MBN9156929.1 hypothetical protein [Microbacterium sp.]